MIIGRVVLTAVLVEALNIALLFAGALGGRVAMRGRAGVTH